MASSTVPAVIGRPRRTTAWWTVAAIGLVMLGALPVATTMMTERSTQALRQTLRDLELINAANAMITQEQVELQRHAHQPSAASAQRFTEAADSATSALRDADASASTRGRADARRLANEQANYLNHAAPVIRVPPGKPVTLAERDAAETAFAALAEDVASVILAYTTTAAERGTSLDSAELAHATATAVTLVAAAGLALLGGLAGIARRRSDIASAQAAQAPQTEHVDPMTELPDQIGFAEHLRGALSEAQRTGGRGVTVLSIDLTGFEQVAQEHGKDGCDQLLVAASRRLRRVVRDIDIVARLGDRGFSVLLHDMTNRPDVQAVTGRIGQVLCRDFRIQTGITTVRASIGIAIGPPDADPDDVVERSRTAMHRMRSTGGGVAFSDRGKDHDSVARLTPELIDDLRKPPHDHAPDQRLLFEYQPVVRLTDGVTTNVDAIVSWRHPAYGSMTPEEVMRVAEDSGLTTPLASRVVRTAADQAVAWQALGIPLTVSVPVSARCLGDPGFVAMVSAALEQTGCPAHLLGLNVPEAAVLAEDHLVTAAFEQLQHAGIPVTISHYGVGASSLPRLHRLRFSEVRLDQSLTRELVATPSQKAVTHDAIDMAHAAGLSVGAGHVADAATLALLHRFGCDHGQGPALSGSVPAAEIAAAMDHAQRSTLGAIMRAGTGT